jgi:hypothetical protein
VLFEAVDKTFFVNARLRGYGCRHGYIVMETMKVPPSDMIRIVPKVKPMHTAIDKTSYLICERDAAKKAPSPQDTCGDHKRERFD